MSRVCGDCPYCIGLAVVVVLSHDRKNYRCGRSGFFERLIKVSIALNITIAVYRNCCSSRLGEHLGLGG